MSDTQQPPWAHAITEHIAAQDPAGAAGYCDADYTETLSEEQRQQLWERLHQAFHAVPHDNPFRDADWLAYTVFQDFEEEPDPAADFITHITDTAISQFRLQFGQLLALPDTKPADLAAIYDHAMDWTAPDFEPSAEQQDEMARHYASHIMYSAYGKVTRALTADLDNPISKHGEHLHSFIIQRVVNNVDNNPACFDQALTEPLCQRAIEDAAKLMILIEGHTLYNQPAKPIPLPPPDPNAQQATPYLDSLIRAVPKIADDWPELVTNARTACMLASRSRIQSEAAYGHLAILHAMVHPPQATKDVDHHRE